MLVLGCLGILHKSLHLLSRLVSSHRRPGARIAWLGADINFGGTREVYLCEFERDTSVREIYSSVDQTNKVKTKKKKIFRSKISTNSGYRLKILAMFHEFLSEDPKKKGLRSKSFM